MVTIDAPAHWESARDVQLALPETGVCSVDREAGGGGCSAPAQTRPAIGATLELLPTTGFTLTSLAAIAIMVHLIFFGLWLAPLGYLAYTSGMFPKALEVVLIVGGVCYLVDMLAAFLVPDLGKQIHGFLAIPLTIAEVWTLGYLLVKGVNVPTQDTPRKS